MVLKNTWVSLEQYFATDQNAVATQVNTNTADIAAKQLIPTAVKTAAYTAVVGDLIPADATSGGFTVTLPSAPADKSVILVKKLDSTANVVTVQRGGTDVFNVASGATTLTLMLQDQTVALQYKASGGIWYVTSHGASSAGLDSRYQRLDAIRDSNGNVILGFDPDTVTPVNYPQIRSQRSGRTTVFFEPGGPDAASLGFLLPAGGVVPLYMNSPGTVAKFQAQGDATDVDLNMASQGAGLVLINNVPAATRKVDSTTSSATPTPAISATRQQYNLTALAANATFGAPTGSPGDGYELTYRIKDNATSRTLTWNAIYRAVGVALPSATTISKTLYVKAIYNSADTKWDVLAVGLET